jgi:cyclic pyranopterin phosphate synthase
MHDVLKHPLLLKRRLEVTKNLEQILKRGYEPSKFCLMPFVNIILEPDGSVGLCRHKGTEHTLGNLKTSSWQEVWNGDKAQKWRQEFISGAPQECLKELAEQKCNLCPELGKMLPLVQKIDSAPSSPLRLTANFNGKCNLQCQMCDVWKLPNGNYTEDNFWSQAREDFFPNLEEIDMLSGEPFIQNDTYKLIEEVSRVNPNCLWSITTNAHWKLNQKITKALDSIKFKNLILSVDSFDHATYAKIRKPGRLDIVLDNIESLLSYQQGRINRGLGSLNINLNFLIQKDNWQEVSTAIDYCLERNIHPFITFCYRPSEHSLLSLSPEKRVHILDSLLESLRWDRLTLCHRLLSPVLNSLDPIIKSDYLLRLQKAKEIYESN